MASPMERQEAYEAADTLIPVETNIFRGRLTRNYARPAIRMG